MLTIIQKEKLQLPTSPDEWIHALTGPTVIEINTKNNAPWRVVSVLVHGNEPSGFLGAFEFLQKDIRPVTNLAIVISSIRAARHTPIFTHRHMPGEFDLNRRFGALDAHDRVTELARDITEYIRGRCPEVVVDLHNTSGKGPSFAVSVSDQTSILQLAGLFTRSMVVTQLIVGSLMEQNFNCPVVTIECGGAHQSQSHSVAFEGLNALATTSDLNSLDGSIINTFYHPTRVKLHDGISLDYGTEANPEVDITLINDIESLNYQTTLKETVLGWLDRPLTDCLTAKNDHHQDIVSELFACIDGKLITKTDLKIFMATRRADIAISDCLFYAVAV